MGAAEATAVTLPPAVAEAVQDVALGQGKNTLFVQNLTLGQPLTQLVKIHHGYEAAAACAPARPVSFRS